MTKTITFRTKAQAALFELEIKGQLSDGHWENATPHDHWMDWCQAEVKHGKDVGRDFDTRKTGYNLNSNVLVDCVGDRMLLIAIMGNAGFSEEFIQAFESVARWDGNNLLPVELPENNNDYWIKKRSVMRPYVDTYVDKVNHVIKDATYDRKQLMNDLNEMSKIMKIKKEPIQQTKQVPS